MHYPIYIASYISPLAPLSIAASSKGVISLLFNSTNSNLRASLKKSYNYDTSIRFIDNEPQRFSALFNLFDRYFSGIPTSFDVELDIRATPFHKRIFKELRGVPFGKLVTYAELAKRAGSPNATRAAGSACARNPLPLIVPCHRVISKSGSIGGYSAGGSGAGLKGVDLKRALLDIEGFSAR